MNSKSKALLKKLLDGFVVIVSILIAFTLDAWWDGHRDRVDLGQDMAIVGKELELNRQLIAFQVDLMTRIVSASDAIIEEIAGAGGTTTMLVPDTSAFLVHSNSTLDASFGAIEAVVYSGRLAAIGDAELRGRLAGMRERFSDSVEEQVGAQRIYEEEMMPYFYEVGIHPEVRRINTEFWGAERVPGRELNSRGMVEYPVNPAVEFLMVRRANLYRASIVEMTRLSRDIEELLGKVAEER